MNRLRARMWGCLLICAGFAAAWSSPAPAASLKVSPASLIVHDVMPGQDHDLYAETGIRLAIHNDDDVPHMWSLSTHRPSECGRWEAGYDEVPDAAWCSFKAPEVTVPAHDIAYAELRLAIPDEEQYYNQHWVVTLSIGGRSNAGVSVAVNVRMQIETAARPSEESSPAGMLAVAPSVLLFDPAGGANEDYFRLFNNTKSARQYRLSPLSESSAEDCRKYLRQGYHVIPNSDWLDWPEELTLPAGSSAAVPVRFHGAPLLADQEVYWEQIVWITSDDGDANFVRIHMNKTSEEGDTH